MAKYKRQPNPFKQNPKSGLLTNFLEAQEERRKQKELANMEAKAAICANHMFVNYIALIADVAFQIQDDIFEKYIGCVEYKKNARLAMILDKYKEVSDKHYEWYSKLVTNPQFYADLRDGAQRHLTSSIKNCIKVMSKVQKECNCKQSQLVAKAQTALVLIKSIELQVEDIKKVIKKQTDCRINGTEAYLLSNEKVYATWVIENYGKRYDEEQDKRVREALALLYSHVLPGSLVKASALYAFKHNKDMIPYFKETTGRLFEINWEGD